MSRQIQKQDDGKYRVWSTIAGGYIIENATEEEIAALYIKDAEVDIRWRIHYEIQRLEQRVMNE
ncbi:hypothetical protein EV294_101299 [Paenibacillus sp. BK033]|uniref:hypothetical protein n=1 Tax=Paenibacillus sp. BK033 TaxID=2512133 RepID=UPI00104F6377|nr:hypothetical protein [Paenibacillus sp. BK033]TCN00849.1 hypothetical protein EV294_101299 [Paenibacillus sp. BK033]